MRNFFVSVLVLISLVACSSTGSQPKPVQLSQLNLHSPHHQLGQEIPSQQQIFTLPEQAKDFLDERFKRYASDKNQVLTEFRKWMGRPGGFEVEYDNQTTFTAEQTFSEQAGNCLALSILTYAFAEHLGLQAHFLEPDVPMFWQMHENFETLADHVNIYIRSPQHHKQIFGPSGYIVDFTLNDMFRYAKRYELSKHDIANSFYHNRAAEALAIGDLELAYSFAYYSLQQSPQKTKNYSLMGIVLRRMGQIELAEQAYNIGMQLDEMDPVLLNNLVFFYRSEQRDYEALLLDIRLDQIKLESPFVIAREAEMYYSGGAYQDALQRFNKAIRQADYIHNFHFGKARALFALGEYEKAQKSLQRAQELSTTREQRARYSSKLVALNRVM